MAPSEVSVKSVAGACRSRQRRAAAGRNPRNNPMMGSTLLPIAFGLLSAAIWGAGDFCGGLATKRTRVYEVIIVGDLVGAILLAGLALAFGEGLPAWRDLGWGALAGLAGVAGLIALYQALASGRMSAASPVAAVVSALVPVVFGMLVDGLPGQVRMAGFGLALVGVWLVSTNDQVRIQFDELGLPLAAGLGFGIFFILIDNVSETAVFWPLVSARVAAVAAVAVYARAAARPPAALPFRPPGRESWVLIGMVGMLDAGGNAFFALAARAGRLDVAAVLASLYPASTVLLAWWILKERISRLQALGVAAAVAAVVLITL
jgi:drug/metabolite transporter (DMT)-like permease